MNPCAPATIKFRKIAKIKLNPVQICECMFFMTFLYRDKSSIPFLFKNEHLHIRTKDPAPLTLEK